MSDIEDMLVADVRSLEESLSNERLVSWNWQQSAETQKARADALAGLLREASARIRTMDIAGCYDRLLASIDAALADNP